MKQYLQRFLSLLLTISLFGSLFAPAALAEEERLIPEERISAASVAAEKSEESAAPAETFVSAVAEETLNSSVGSGTLSDTVFWTIDGNGVLNISGEGEIPDFENTAEHPWGKGSATTLAISQGITRIGNAAFAGERALTSVSLPAGLLSIGREAFSGCTQLRTVSLPEGLTTLDVSVFSYCSSLSSASLPGSITLLPDGLFSFCTSLRSLWIPDGVKIVNSVFQSCESLYAVRFPAAVESINQGCFNVCAGIKELYYAGSGEQWNALIADKPATKLSCELFLNSNSYFCSGSHVWREESVTLAPTGTEEGRAHCSCLRCGAEREETLPATGATVVAAGECGTLRWSLDSTGCLSISGSGNLPDYANEAPPWSSFSTSVTSLLVVEGVKSLGTSAFTDMTALRSVMLPNSLTGLGDYCFCNCSSLTTLEIPAGLVTVSGDCFTGCSSMTSFVKVGASDNECIDVVDGILFRKNSGAIRSVIRCPEGKSGSVTIPESVTQLESTSFANCRNITNLSLPDGITELGNLSLFSCASLTALRLPAKLKTIGYSALSGCNSLESITVAPDNESYSAVDGVLYTRGCAKLLLYPAARIGNGYTIPASTWGFDVCAFDDALSLTEIDVASGSSYFSSRDGMLYSRDGTTLVLCPRGRRGNVVVPSEVRTIQERAFYHCRLITAIDLPDSVTEIGANAFSDCVRLSEFRIPECVKELSGTFFGCENLIIVHIPVSVTKLYNGVLDACPSLRTLCYGGSEDELKAISLTQDVKTVLQCLEICYHCQEYANWGETRYVWSGDHKRCTAERTDLNNPERSEIAEGVVSAKEMKPDCENDGYLCYTAAFSQAWATAQSATIPTGSASGHKWQINGGRSGEVRYCCARCGRNQYEPGPVLTITSDTPALATGKATTIRSSFSPSNVTGAALQWTVSDGSLATVTKLNKTEARLTAAKILNERCTVTVTAVATDGSTLPASCTVELCPTAQSVSISSNTDLARRLDLSEELCLSASVCPADASQHIRWSSSNKLFPIDPDTGAVSVLNGAKAATVTFTATATDGSGKKAAVKVGFQRLMRPEDLSLQSEATLASGKSVTLSYNVDKAVTNKTLLWTICEGAEYATLKKNRLTANKNLTEPVDVLITATACDGSGVCKSCSVRLFPVAMSVELYGLPAGTTDLYSARSVQMFAAVTPAKASQTVKWSSSSKLYPIDPDTGVVTIAENARAATVTFTAKAIDGSGKKTAVRLKFGRLMHEGDLSVQSEATVMAGKSVTLSYTVNPTVSDRGLSWSITEGAEYAVLKNNKLTALKELSKAVTVTVRATAKDGSGISESCSVKLTPRTQRLGFFTNDGREVTGSKEAFSTAVYVKSFPEDAARQWTVSCNNKAVIPIVYENGLINYTLKPDRTLADGTELTFTVKAADGSGQTGKVILMYDRWTQNIK